MDREASGKNHSYEHDPGGAKRAASVGWGLVLTGMTASCSAVLLITFGSNAELNDTFTALCTFVLVWSMFSTGVSAQIKKIVEAGYFREASWVSMLSPPLGITAGLLVYLVALVFSGDSLLDDSLGFWNRLSWAAPILIVSGLAYIAPSYLMATYAKMMAELENQTRIARHLD